MLRLWNGKILKYNKLFSVNRCKKKKKRDIIFFLLMD